MFVVAFSPSTINLGLEPKLGLVGVADSYIHVSTHISPALSDYKFKQLQSHGGASPIGMFEDGG